MNIAIFTNSRFVSLYLQMKLTSNAIVGESQYEIKIEGIHSNSIGYVNMWHNAFKFYQFSEKWQIKAY